LGKEREKNLKKTLSRRKGCLEVCLLAGEKYLYFNVSGIIMTLEDFFKECKKTGATPLSYESHIETLHGSKTIKYENPIYAKAKKRVEDIIGSHKEREDDEISDIVSRLYGENVVIRTKDGYHHGILAEYDGKSFYLDRHIYKDKLMNYFDYSINSMFSEGSAVPAEGIISISKIPMHTWE